MEEQFHSEKVTVTNMGYSCYFYRLNKILHYTSNDSKSESPEEMS